MSISRRDPLAKIWRRGSSRGEQRVGDERSMKRGRRRRRRRRKRRGANELAREKKKKEEPVDDEARRSRGRGRTWLPFSIYIRMSLFDNIKYANCRLRKRGARVSVSVSVNLPSLVPGFTFHELYFIRACIAERACAYVCLCVCVHVHVYCRHVMGTHSSRVYSRDVPKAFARSNRQQGHPRSLLSSLLPFFFVSLLLVYTRIYTPVQS